MIRRVEFHRDYLTIFFDGDWVNVEGAYAKKIKEKIEKIVKEVIE